MVRYILVVIIFSVAFFSCEDVIDVDVPTAESRLVIEASLDWEKGTTGNEQTIKLSMSTPFFETNQNTAVIGAIVTVINENNGDIFDFIDQNDGTYTTTNFLPILNNTYRLEVNYNGETFHATETLISVSDIDEITQSTEGGFDDDLLELNLYFNDPANIENYYLIKYEVEGDMFPYLEVRSDEFVDGNQIHDFFEKDDDEDDGETPFQVGDVVHIGLYGISEQYYNYMRLLIEQYEAQGDPFNSNAVQLQGNCINLSNPENDVYGYFRLTQFAKASYTFQ